MSLNVAVLYGSVRAQRKGIRAARFVVRTLEERGHEVTLVDPREQPLPLLDRMYKEYDPGEAPEPMDRLARIFEAADALVVVSGEYNHGLPAALKNHLDHFQAEYYWKPAGIVTYSAGAFGGTRAGVHLRSVLAELGMVTLPSQFVVSRVRDAFDEEGRALDEAYARRIGKFLAELEWYGEALRTARSGGTPY